VVVVGASFDDQFEVIERALDALGSVDVDGLSDDELERFVVRIMRVRDRSTVTGAAACARWDDREVWRRDGSLSAAAKLSRLTHCAPATARAGLRRAHAVEDLPEVAAAVDEGRLSVDHLDLFARARGGGRDELMARDEPVLVAQACSNRWNDTTRIVEYWRQRADDELAADPTTVGAVAPVSEVYVSATIDGRVEITGSLDAISGEIVRDELQRLTDELRRHDVDRERTPAEWRALALVEMATRSRAMPSGARRPQPLFTVLIGDDTARHLCELASGTVLTVDGLVPHLDTALLETVLFDGHDRPLSVSRRRTFTGRLRRAIEVRDRRCTHTTGCDVPASRCDVDHTIPHAMAGPTAVWNGRLECRPHNRTTHLHDHHTTPLPAYTPHILDVIRARLRWAILNDDPDDPDR
jgi:hypothetical protein